MNALDLLVLIIISIFLIMGIFGGLIKGLSSLVSLLAGLLLAGRYAHVAGAFLAGCGVSAGKGILAYVLAFIVFFLVFKVIFRLARALVGLTPLRTVDRLLGGCLGIVKGALVSLVVLTVSQVALPPESAVLKDSAVVPVSNVCLEHVRALVPPEFVERVHS